MRLGILSDIHGNCDALEEVLKEARSKNVDHLLILGDIVGYYYHPDKILKLLSEWSFEIIKGNHEKILEELLANPTSEESIRLKYGSGHKEALKKLSHQQMGFLAALPETKSVLIDELSILMCHGSPWSNDYYVYPDCSKEVAAKCDSKDHDFVLIGHSHYAFAINNENSVLINPGSVGQSRQVGGKANWAIINTVNRCFQLLETDYDIDVLLNEVAEKDADIKYLKNVLLRR